MPHLIDDAAETDEGGLVLQLPDVEPDRLLVALRQVTGCSGLGFAESPTRLGSGGEAVVDAFQLSGAPSGFDGPLVLRRLLPLKDPNQVPWEAAVHATLAAQGFPVPRVLHADSNGAALGAPFLVMERVPGRILLEAITRPGEIASHPARIPGLIYEALARVPRVLGQLQARLHQLDPEPLRHRLSDAGFAPSEISFAGRVERLAQHIDKHALDGLAEGLAWLRANLPADAGEVICHGDFVFTNICVDAGRATGVFDWSTVAFAEPAYDVAATLARLKSNVPGIPAWLAWITRTVQGHLERRYLAWYRRTGTAAPDRVRYYESYWLLHELVWSGERLRAGAVPDDAIEHRWLHAETIDRGVADFASWTGVRLAPLLPLD